MLRSNRTSSSPVYATVVGENRYHLITPIIVATPSGSSSGVVFTLPTVLVPPYSLLGDTVIEQQITLDVYGNKTTYRFSYKEAQMIEGAKQVVFELPNGISMYTIKYITLTDNSFIF